MKIATWNVNSLRVRMGHVRRWLQEHQPDILAMQETKCMDDAFPALEFQALGYQIVYSGQKTYNGVAIASREAVSDVVTDMPGTADHQRRLLAATIGGVRVIDVYVPNGKDLAAPEYGYKLGWLQDLADYVRDQLRGHARLVVLGDINIAPEPRDVHNPTLWEGRLLYSQPERDAFGTLLSVGLEDQFRLFEQPEKSFSWWDYQMGAFRRDLGLRIDHILGSREMSALCTGCTIDKDPRRWERPSDHTPVVAEYRL